MELDVCMNGACKNGYAREWKKGWPLRSGGFARLCDKCGSAYANSIFCEKFHLHQTGWRECNFCNKSIHCGCIISRFSFEYLDFGGIGCSTCLRASPFPLIQETGNSIRSIRSVKNHASDRHTEHIDDRLFLDGSSKRKPMHMRRIVDGRESSRWPQVKRDDIHSCIDLSREEMRFSNVMKPSNHSLKFTALENNRPTWENRSMHRSSSLNISLGASSGNPVLPSASAVAAEGRFDGKTSSSSFHQGQRSLSIMPKPLMNAININMESSNGMISQERVARPPTDGKGKNMLLSRYWPRITDQELQQLSGDLKSTIVPLFEKVLSASDAGRIGRLVLPKSCAEAYFPPISQSEGLPLHMKDVKGNEWTFQFRFWPNNNSRMYVLEGVTPCIQALQLNAGDIVIFSRIDPGGKFVLGFRRASDSTDTQDASAAHSNVLSTKETTFSGATAGNSYHDLLQTRKGNGDPYLNKCSEHFRLGTAGIAERLRTENSEIVNKDLVQLPISVSEKTQNIGPMCKRLLIHNEDAMELRVTWEEAQDLLCPAPSIKSNIVTVEDQEFEEYEEPPVFGKRTTINARSSGSLSFASEEMSPKELDNIPVIRKDSKVVKLLHFVNIEIIGVLEDDVADRGDSSAGATTKYPRHRSGCTCIVCIQASSGKGRHSPPCITVERRLDTLLTRKKQRLGTQKDEDEGDGACLSEKEGNINKGCLKKGELSAGQIDLNCRPNLDEDMQVDI
ncbi:B3 domain-containing transcription repressor VAL2 Protein [Vigna angularis]|uniref:B3 domain-containing transcription repressor VAL2 Protein n=1 Tax=Phaseolus angularis TaxID=3914 RepID=A0A8T0K2W7_PHAAN|nr:B3 domain-containing transcription repressor VAL2 Protein [Vigna angularis]